jgi:hypothetical protein
VRRGIDLLGDTDPKRARLQSWLDYDVRVRFQDRLLDFDAVLPSGGASSKHSRRSDA